MIKEIFPKSKISSWVGANSQHHQSCRRLTMASLNRIQLLGNLTDNPELRYTPSGKSVLSFMLNVEDENSNFFPIYVSGKLAELCNDLLRKDSRIYLEGRLLISEKTVIKTMSTFGDEEFEEEEDRYFVQILAKKIDFLDNPQPNKPAFENKKKIEDVIQFLEIMTTDSIVDHKMLINLANKLNSLDLENID